MTFRQALQRYVAPFESIATEWMHFFAVIMLFSYGAARYFASSPATSWLIVVFLLAFVVAVHLATTVQFTRAEGTDPVAYQWATVALFIGGILLVITTVTLLVLVAIHRWH